MRETRRRRLGASFVQFSLVRVAPLTIRLSPLPPHTERILRYQGRPLFFGPRCLGGIFAPKRGAYSFVACCHHGRKLGSPLAMTETPSSGALGRFTEVDNGQENAPDRAMGAGGSKEWIGAVQVQIIDISIT